MRHKWADLIIAWAEGAEIQHNFVTNPDDSPWLDCMQCPAWNSEHVKFRRKPKEPDWWENIPEHGVLCWVSDYDSEIKTKHATNLRVIILYDPTTALPFVHHKAENYFTAWKYATPLTNEEIEEFKR